MPLVPVLIRCPDGERGTGTGPRGSPLVHFLRFILWGSGEVAPPVRAAG